MAIQIFNNDEFGRVRVIEIGGEPYFVGADVANALGYKDTFAALKQHVDDEDKLVWQITSAGQKRDATVINESGVYSLILRSNLPKAREFKRWVTSEVLPSIRKTNIYVNPQATAISPDFLRRIADELETRNKQIAALNEQVTELEPKANYYDVILNCKDLASTTQIAKDYGMTARAFNQLLAGYGVQYNRGGVWYPRKTYAQMGWMQSKTHTYLADGETHCKTHMYWTQKGRLGVYDLLKYNGITPQVERG